MVQAAPASSRDPGSSHAAITRCAVLAFSVGQTTRSGYFAYGANMHDSALRVRRGIQPLRVPHRPCERLSAALQLRRQAPGKAAPANCAQTGRRGLGRALSNYEALT